MFFLVAITQRTKELARFTQICFECGQYGQYQVVMTYSVLLLFFIPVFRWNKQYYVQSKCCDALFMLNKEKGKEFEKGQAISLEPKDVVLVSKKFVCPSCGRKLQSKTTYCPHCGHAL